MSKQTPSEENLDMISRWRLVLGKDAERHGLGLGNQSEGRNGNVDLERIEDLVGFLFEEGDAGEGGVMAPEDRRGGSGASTMTVQNG